MSDKEAIKILIGLLRKYNKKIMLIVFCLFISTGLNLLIPLISRQIMDDGFIGGNKELIIKLVLASLTIYAINYSIDIFKEQKRIDIAAKIQYLLSEQSFSHLIK